METFFERLEKKVSIPEDFVTEALKSVMLSLSLEELNLFMTSLLNYNIDFEHPIIYSQLSEKTERYDLSIQDEEIEIIFENKWDSPSYLDQLKRYDNRLSENGKKTNILVHLTKDYENINYKFNSIFRKIAWSDVYISLHTFQKSYMVSEFLQFLKNKGITMDKVNWQIIEGAKSVKALQHIISRAAQELDLTVKWRGGSSNNTEILIDDKLYAWFFLDTGEFFLGVYDLEKFKDRKGRNWTAKKFDFDKHCFFHKSYEGQLEAIKSFIKETMDEVNNV